MHMQNYRTVDATIARNTLDESLTLALPFARDFGITILLALYHDVTRVLDARNPFVMSQDRISTRLISNPRFRNTRADALARRHYCYVVLAARSNREIKVDQRGSMYLRGSSRDTDRRLASLDRVRAVTPRRFDHESAADFPTVFRHSESQEATAAASPGFVLVT